MRRLVFLDVDGVLNDLNVLSSNREELGRSHLNNLKSIVLSTNSEIVLSSTWRLYNDHKTVLQLAFEEFQIPLWIDQTPWLKSTDSTIYARRDEIVLWLKENVDQDALVAILDDDGDANISNHNLPNVRDKFFKTCMNQGLTENIAQEVVNFFSSSSLG